MENEANRTRWIKGKEKELVKSAHTHIINPTVAVAIMFAGDEGSSAVVAGAGSDKNT